MKKLTSLFMTCALVATSCVCAVSAAAADEDIAKITVVDASTGTTKVYNVPVGDKVECTVTGYSDKAITGILGLTYINQENADTLVE